MTHYLFTFVLRSDLIYLVSFLTFSLVILAILRRICLLQGIALTLAFYRLESALTFVAPSNKLKFTLFASLVSAE
jgi:hypothetical protein